MDQCLLDIYGYHCSIEAIVAELLGQGMASAHIVVVQKPPLFALTRVADTSKTKAIMHSTKTIA